MTVLFALLSALALPQADDVEALRKEVQALKDRLQAVEQQTLEDARTIHRLRLIVKALESSAQPKAAPADAGPAPAAAATEDFPRPSVAIVGKVVHVDPINNFITLSCGKKDGVAEGYRFEIFRETFENGADAPQRTKLILGQAEKFFGTDHSLTKLKVLDGHAKEVRLDDVAVAIRRLEPVAAGEKPPPAPAPNPDGIYKITGRTGAAYMLNYGGLQGAKQTDVVYVYKEGVLKAKMRLDRVDKAYSVANIIPGSAAPGVPPPDTDDDILLREPNKILSGKVSYVNAEKQNLAIDLRTRDGVKVGMKFEVVRQGKPVGVIEITDVQQWGSWTKPHGDTTFADIQKGDLVKVIESK
ncbi:MAG TPA: hypothetical protein VEJ18_07945 [Planctomycetota bacterium]|nr:hypothetical protein [Planctomycetota bacterium]